MVVKKKREKVVKDHTTKNNKHATGMYLIPSHTLCFLLFVHTTFILPHTSLCGMVGGKEVWMRSSVWI